jgi:hypothetical protein
LQQVAQAERPPLLLELVLLELYYRNRAGEPARPEVVVQFEELFLRKVARACRNAGSAAGQCGADGHPDKGPGESTTQ